jgi:Na+-transporting methylmalonyl-CoA/oxaloacetate decarboxylase gamma subunit
MVFLFVLLLANKETVVTLGNLVQQGKKNKEEEKKKKKKKKKK